MRPLAQAALGAISSATMATYEIRFLRPDGAYGATATITTESDQAAKSYVIENYARKPLELWRDGERLTRRTSDAFERRLRNDRYYPSQLRFAVMDAGRNWETLDFAAFETVGRFSDQIFQNIREHLAPYPIWVRANGHAQAPASVDQKVRVSISAGRPYEGEISGNLRCDLWSREADGDAVFEDCREVVVAALFKAVADAGGGEDRDLISGTPWPDGIYRYQPLGAHWRLTLPSHPHTSY